jgi:hypothetical protein
MAVLKTYECKKHGEFEAWSEEKVRCPAYGCRCKPKEMPCGPSLLSWQTKNADSTLKGLAKDFGMTNIKSTREGESQSGYLTRNNKTPASPPPQVREPRPGDAAIWGNKGGFDMGSIMSGNRFRSVRGETVGVKPGEVGANHGPRAASYYADHENLKIK